MPLTLSQFLFLVLTFSAVVAVTFLVKFLIQLQKTAREGEKTLIEVHDLVVNLNATSQKVNQKIEELGDLVDAARKAAVGLSEASLFLSTRIMRPAARYWPLALPLIRLVLRQWKKKKKEEKNGQ
jgi:hypothetical protein